MKTETSVQWLKSKIETMLNGHFGSPWIEIFEQAKAMEKEQIIEAYCNGNDNIGAEQYYNEKYKQE